MDTRSEIREFLASRRARLTPEQAGLRTYATGPRRVPGLRREEVAMLAGVSVDYYLPSVAAAHAVADEDARCDPEYPPKDGGGEDDPDERGTCRADHPTQLHGACVGSDQQDENDERRHEQHGPGVNARPTSMAAEALPPRLATRPLVVDDWPYRHST